MSDTHQDIAIVGAGISGLVLALALHRAGIAARVYEQAPVLGEVGAGISLSPNAVKGLHFAGIGDALEQVSDEPRFQRTRHYQTGELLVEVSRAKTREQLGAPYLQLHRADLHGLLSKTLLELAPDAIELGCKLENVEAVGDQYRLEFQNGRRVSANLVVGADGLRSVVRERVFAQSPPTFAGFVAWRGLLPAEALGDVELLDGGNVFIAPDRIFVRYPIRHERVQNFVAFARTADDAEEGWSRTGSTADLRELFSDFHEDVQKVLTAFTPSQIPMWGLFDRPPLPRWVSGQVTVMGDAAHPMLPWFGQGAATSIEDAVVLARALVEFDSRSEALKRYENARRERVTVMHLESRNGGERLMQADPGKLAREPVKTEDTLGLTQYNPVTAPL